MDALTLKLIIITVVVITAVVISYRAASDFLRIMKQDTEV